MGNNRFILITIIVIVLFAIINALASSGVISLGAKNISDSEVFIEVKNDLEKLEEVSSESYKLDEYIYSLKKMKFKVNKEGGVYIARSPLGKGDLVVTLVGKEKLEEIKIESRLSYDNNIHNKINELYINRIYGFTKLPASELEDAELEMGTIGLVEGNFVERLVGENLLYLGYNQTLNIKTIGIKFNY